MRRNLIPNPSFEVGAAGWTSSEDVPQRIAANPPAEDGTGAWVCAVSSYDGSATSSFYTVDKVPVSPGETYTLSIYVYRNGNSGTGDVIVDLDWYDSTEKFLSSASRTFPDVPAHTWTRVHVTGTAPAGAAFARRCWVRNQTYAVGDNFYFDGAMLEPGDTLGPYADGDTDGWQWDGTPHYSTSREIPNTAPTADAGPDQTVVAGEVVQLDGSGSTDAEDPADGLGYSWTVADDAGTGLTTSDLAGANTATPSFTAPPVGAAATLVIRLTVTDSGGLTGTDTVTVTVKPAAQGSVDLSAGATLTADADVFRNSVGLAAGTVLSADARIVREAALDVSAAVALASQARLVADAQTTLPVRVAGEFVETYHRGQVFVATPPADTTRVIAQDILTGEFLDWDFPLSGLKVTYRLSGPTVITGRLGPEIPHLSLDAYDGWATWLHVEEEGLIRASGILLPASLDAETLSLECEGPSGYPHGIPYLGEFSKIGVDPLDVVRLIWDHLQSYPDGKLGVQVDATKSSVRLGTPKDDKDPESGPYTLNWWDTTDCGDEINDLAKQTPFDYAEHVQWNPGKTGVEHRIRLGYPRLGRRRHDLRFAQGENITSIVPLVELGDFYASAVVVTGAGEGRAMVRGTASRREGPRLRRVAVLSDQSVKTTARAKKLAADELRRRAARVSFQKITINAQHPNARLGTFELGDDILVTAVFPYVGQAAIWHRITAYTWSRDSDEVELELAPSESFNYGPPIGR